MSGAEAGSSAEGANAEVRPASPGGQRPRGFHHSFGRTVAELGLIALAIGLVLLSARGCAGCLGEMIVARLPASVDAAIGQAGGEAMRAQYGAKGAPTPEQTARVERIFGELREHLTPEQAQVLIRPRVTVAADDQVNAFALPGGEVFVLTGLLDRTKEDDAMLRGVLAHELGHAVRRHGVRSLVRNSVYGIALAFVLGDLDGMTATVIAGASQLDELSYSRSMEEEADAFGVDLLARAGHSPEGLARFLESLEAQPVPALLSTHPDSADRAKAIRARMGR